MRILITADLHFSNKLPYSKIVENGETDRIRFQTDLVWQIGNIADEYCAEAVMILGDIFDSRMVDAITLDLALESLVRLSDSTPVYLLSGNHEAVSVSVGRFLPQVARHITNLRVMEKPFVLKEDTDVEFFPVNWCTSDLAKERILGFRRRRKKSILLLHHAINGGFSGGWKCDGELSLEDIGTDWEVVFSGHFHEPQSLGNGLIHYVGAPMCHSFSDLDRDRGVIIFDTERSEITRVGTEHPRFYVFDYSDMKSKGLDLSILKPGDLVRIDITATNSEYIKEKVLLDEILNKISITGATAKIAYNPKPDIINRLSEVRGGGLYRAIIDSYLDAGYGEDDREELSKMGNLYLEAARG